MASETRKHPVSSGIEELLRRLREDGVAAGRAEAERIVEDALEQAKAVVAGATADAERIVAEARTEADELRAAGKQALEVAARDAVLALKSALVHRFRNDIRRLVAVEMEKSELLQRMILEIAGRARGTVERADQVELVLPRDVVGIEEIRRKPEELSQGEATRFVKSVAGELLREGVTLREEDGKRRGLRIELSESGVVLDLSDEAIAGLLLDHLQPRFRALLDGIVR